MLTKDIKQTIDNARNILVGKIPNPQSQIEQITIAMIYKFMDDMDIEPVEMGGKREFFVEELEQYAWSKIMSEKLGNQVRMNLYTEALEELQHSKRIPKLFRDIFKGAYLPFRDGQTLTLFLKEINDLSYDDSESLGDGFEYLLSIMGSQGDAGQFRTPRHIIDFIVDVVKPTKTDRILDPACGTAGFLISAYKYILKDAEQIKHNLTPKERKSLTENIQGYDISPDMVKLALVNMYLHKFKEPKIYEYDTLSKTEKWDDYFDCILANPPFMTPKGGIQPHNKFAIKANRSEVLFVDYIMEHIKSRAGVIVPEGIVFQSANAYKQLRKKLVDENYLYAVVSLPSGVFQPYSGVKTSILFMDKTFAKKTDKILFVEVQNDGFDLGAQRRQIDKNDLPKALELINDWQKSINTKKEFKSNSTIVTVVEKTKLAKNEEYNLTASRYKETKDYSNCKWEKFKLGELCELKRGNAITKKDIVKGSIPVVAGGQNPAYYHNEYNRYGETITIAGSGAYAGFISYYTTPIFVSDAFTIKSLDDRNVLTKYVYYILKARQEYVYSLQSGMGIPHVYAKDLVDYKIPLPPIEIQEQIIKELDSYQAVIDGAQKVIDNWKPTFQINPNWQKVKLNNEKYFLVESGGTPSSNDPTLWDGNINWVTLVDLPQEDYISILTSTKRTITQKGLSKSSAKLLPENSILISSRATIGRVAINKIKLATNQGFKNIIIKDFSKINIKFLALNIKKLSDKMNLMATGGTFKEISKTAIGALEVFLPPIEEQDKIVSKIEQEEKAIEGCKKLIKIQQGKINSKLQSIWGENE
ncbi:N-6 DNA methylase [Candidatus Ruminimicrobium bovinum]|uniref:N-6 DNA methylase n=1 Tax=Candidatus Ruminimicrobium bovinum TaxID=3242779 RepID=UPI0039B9ABA7